MKEKHIEMSNGYKGTTEITYESETCYEKEHVTMSNGYKDTTDSPMKGKHAQIRSVEMRFVRMTMKRVTMKSVKMKSMKMKRVKMKRVKTSQPAYLPVLLSTFLIFCSGGPPSKI